jgi:hypothetical protein
LKLTNCSQVKTTDVFLTNIFRTCLLLYLRLTIAGMKKKTLIKHKEATVVCEERGPISLNYNDLLTTLEANIIAKPIVYVITSKSTSTYTNCGKIGHTPETRHNMKREVPIIPTPTIKSTKLVV